MNVPETFLELGRRTCGPGDPAFLFCLTDKGRRVIGVDMLTRTSTKEVGVDVWWY